jgi:hypothetical protein
MKTLRIVIFLVIGIAYILYRITHPEHGWMAIFILLATLFGVYWLTRLIGGKELADTSPLAADSMPSLNLSERALENDKSKPSSSSEA